MSTICSFKARSRRKYSCSNHMDLSTKTSLIIFVASKRHFTG
ncbi:hypothetical protein MtrunA17_Chr6g0474351 [Medicago truncatula]|uniref:Uncharacterized protein n=1 Tax=Medicago truncatula TaxID=3880 RepID=A0A396HF70_MEDTR|nr:hypothetical protein MtrunA17_Chr6g0474351 [Medicago truncatula]